jgi:AcrR family transcriptional regulator
MGVTRDAGHGRATKDRILDAAEALFGELGFGDTSMRQLAATAGVNLAAANYHFGSKENLLSAVLSRRFGPINDLRIARLAQLDATGGPVALEALLEAFLAPALALLSSPDGARFLRLLGRIHGEPERSPAQAVFYDQFGKVREHFMPRFEQVLPHLGPLDVVWRVHFMVGAMAHTMVCGSGLEFLSEGRCDRSNADAVLRQLIAFAAGGLRAAAAGD